MGEQIRTPLQQHRQTTPIDPFPSSFCMEDQETSSIDTGHMKRLLADVTSLVLLSASADRAGGTVGSVASFIADLERTTMERLRSVQGGMDLGRSEKPECGTFLHRQATPMPSEVKRSYEHLLLAVNPNTLTTSRPRSDLVSLQSAADSNITDRPLCMTFDSGISSPASAIIPGRSDEGDYRPMAGEQAAVIQDLQQRLNYLKVVAERRIVDSVMGSIPAGPTKEVSDIRGRLRDAAGGTLSARHSAHPDGQSVPELFTDITLSSSLLAFENTKLSAEVDYLKKKVEILEDIAGTKGFTIDALKTTMETISIGSQTDEISNQPSNLDETDFGISDFSLTSPETNHLMSTAICKDGDFLHEPANTSTPGTASNKRTQRRRKIEVPTQLKDLSMAASTSYLSVNRWADAEYQHQNGSPAGCWKGLLTCCYRPH